MARGFFAIMPSRIKGKVSDMLKSLPKLLPLAALAVMCGSLTVPGQATAATAAGSVFAPGALPQGVFQSTFAEKAQARRRPRARRRGARRGRRGARRLRRGGRRVFRRRGRRHRGPRFAFRRIPIPYYYGTPYYAYDPYYGGYDYTPVPPPTGGRCARWSRRCSANWGYGNSDYWGCMRYHGCD